MIAVIYTIGLTLAYNEFAPVLREVKAAPAPGEMIGLHGPPS